MKNKLVSFFMLALFFQAILLAQGTSKDTGNIRGFVKDNEGNPLPGVTITVSGPAIMGTRSTVTNEEGAFRVPLLPVGIYSITAELQGFQKVKRENIEVTLGGTVTVTIEMMPAKVEEEITVTAASPVVDVKTSAIANVYKSDLLLNLPIGRALGNVVTLAPGVVSSSQVRGGTAANTIYQVDGLYANDPDNAQLGVNVDFNIMEEVNVMTGGMPAEVGISSGAFVNVVTKSGGNKFSGLIDFIYTDDSMSKPVIPEDHLRALGLGRPTVALYNYSTSFSLGGPIIKDRLWFFANGRYGRSETPSGFVKWTSPIGITYDEFNRKSWNWGGFFKLTFQPRQNLRLVLNGNARESYINTRASGLFMPADCHYHDDPWGNYNGFGALTWIIDPNTYLEFRGGYLTVDAWLTLVRDELDDIPSYYDAYTGYYFGSGYRPNDWVGRPSTQASLHFTRFQDNFLGGDHEFKAGLELVTGAGNWASWKRNPIRITYYNGSPYYWRGLYGLTGPHPTYGDGQILLYVIGQKRENSVAKAANIRYSGYLQDSWTIKHRLTINLGLRYDYEEGWIPDIYKERSGGISYSVGEATLKVLYGMNPYDEFRQEGVDDFIKWSLFTPRIGITYDLFGNGKTALKLQVGRFSSWLYSSFFMSYNPIRLSSYTFNWWDLNGNGKPDEAGIDKYVVVTTRSPLVMLRDYWSRLVDKNLKATYDDQIIIGIDHELFPNFRVGLSYQYKHKKNIVDDALYDFNTGQFWYMPDSPYWVPFTTTVPAIDNFPAAQVTLYYPTKNAPEMLRLLTNIPEAYRKYWGFDFTFEKRFSHGWHLGGSVTYSKTWGNHPGDYGNIFGYAATANTANWVVNTEGRLGDDRPLVIKLYGTFNLPYGFVASFYYNHYSGTPWQRTCTIYVPSAWAAANNVDTVRGSSYTVNVEPQGSRRSYTYQNCDARLDKRFNIGRFGYFSVIFEVYNLFGTHYVNVVQNPGGTWRPVDNNTTVGTYTPSANYKRVTSISNLSRTFQISLRYGF